MTKKHIGSCRYKHHAILLVLDFFLKMEMVRVSKGTFRVLGSGLFIGVDENLAIFA